MPIAMEIPPSDIMFSEMPEKYITTKAQSTEKGNAESHDERGRQSRRKNHEHHHGKKRAPKQRLQNRVDVQRNERPRSLTTVRCKPGLACSIFGKRCSGICRNFARRSSGILEHRKQYAIFGVDTHVLISDIVNFGDVGNIGKADFTHPIDVGEQKRTSGLKWKRMLSPTRNSHRSSEPLSR